MIATPIRCVLDASVGIKRVVTEPDSAQARALFDHLVKDVAANFFVPTSSFWSVPTSCGNWSKKRP
jgi:hypothetical protein